MADLKVKCVKTDNGAPTDALKVVFESLKEAELDPIWVSEMDCMAVNQRERDSMYIIDPFEGRVFEHLKNVNNRLYGPQCLLACLKNAEAAPRAKHPIYTLGMKNLVISCTGVEKNERERLHNLVELMGGEVSRNFTQSVTHLVAGEVGSKKYLVAGGLSVAIMLPQWVDKVWEKSKQEYCHGSDPEFQAYKCPLFKDLVITVSGISNDERAEVKQVVEAQGGRYTGEMKINDCTHLIVNEPKGQKYEFAVKWKIHIVCLAWLFESVQNGYCMDENKFRVGNMHNAKTPGTKKTSGQLPCITDMSNITNVSVTSNIDETAVITTNQTRMSHSNKSLIKEPESKDPLDDLDLSSRMGDAFLDGCKLFLSGFKSSQIEKLRRIINTGGGTRFNQLNDNVSHVIVGEAVEEHIKQIMEMKSRPHVVSCDWLVQCFQQGIRVDENKFRFSYLPHLDQTSQTVLRSGSRTPAELEKTAATAVLQEDEDMDNIISQYLPQHSDMTDESALLKVIEQEEAEMQQDQGQGELDDADMTEIEGEQGIFNKKTFVILGFDLDQVEALREMIEENKGEHLDDILTEYDMIDSENEVKTGSVLANTSRVVPDFGLVPILGVPIEVTVTEIVTNAWLQMCVENSLYLDPGSNPLFSPIEVKPDCRPLEGCVLSVSGYSGVERDCLMHLAELLGAKTQEFFVRKTSKKLLASTHLLVREADGSKYQAATKWNLPAVTSQWIFACARNGQRVPEEDFLVDKDKINLELSKPSQKEIEKQVIIHREKSAAKVESFKKKTSETMEKQEFPVTDPKKLTDSDKYDLNKKSDTFVNGLKDKPNDKNEKIEYSGPLVELGECTSSVETAGKPKTPRPTNSRLMALKQPRAGSEATPKRQSLRLNTGIDTPGKFLAQGKEFHPSFDLQEFEQALHSPASQYQSPRSRRQSRHRKASLPIEEVFSHHMSQAIKNTAVCTNPSDVIGQKEAKGIDKKFQEQASGPLCGVTIAVSRKLSNNQSDYNNMAALLGADYRWTYDETCTHFIFQGRNNDTSKEFRVAREQGKCIVSPYWLQMCHEQKSKVEETLFPPNYNPNLSLTVVSKKITPVPATRRSTRASVRSSNAASPPPAPSSPPAPNPPPAPSIEDDQEGEETGKDGFQIDTTQSDEEMAIDCEGFLDEKKKDSVSLEMNAALSKQLENIMAATKAQKQSRRSMKRANSTAENLNSSAEAVSDSNRSRPPSSKSFVKSADEDANTALDKKTSSSVKGPTSHPEPSQSLQDQVGWDDPVSRLEQEKLARELQRATSPTQLSESLSPVLRQKEHRYSSEEDQGEKTDEEIVFKAPTDLKKETRTIALEAPTIVTPKPGEQTQPVKNSTQADNEADDTFSEREDKAKVFMLSGMSPQIFKERDHYGALIELLGGCLLDSQVYDPRCTHLVVGTPTRNEKYLACVSTGKWVLHKSYFEACKTEGKFLDEADHEWGGPAMDSLLHTMKEQVVKLGKAAHRWRLHIAQTRMHCKCAGAFEGWNVIICTEISKEGGFKRLLEAGGAKVIATRPPFSKLTEVTHAFMDLAKIKYEVNIQALLKEDIQCLRPEYIASYLMEDPPPAYQAYYITEVHSFFR
ncbi:DNA topoisomerase 2-binding protein 1 isoform X2 [Lingula anatina]|uniref:DNA topoisomerase 2-binding protein 1 isoform X2 n=1 Tax=Lingula anatina TaxID=7574 RepID=A0A2R2MS66_LINAN|nr:DNA topoisomerase 2-binding protein 1 isoform X2 [Lingula anatina]|eukprot:XP_023933099.1 DNA topoisomerase 2-binding protein 1 isoform X2 [Lingula anatina]